MVWTSTLEQSGDISKRSVENRRPARGNMVHVSLMESVFSTWRKGEDIHQRQETEV